jgi:hypothetical protein
VLLAAEARRANGNGTRTAVAPLVFFVVSCVRLFLPVIPSVAAVQVAGPLTTNRDTSQPAVAPQSVLIPGCACMQSVRLLTKPWNNLGLADRFARGGGWGQAPCDNGEGAPQ